ncbi:MAG TPA: glycosyltransferase [Verrucomicrobiae bacterium]|jgi:glycosyltransferase involved in cell wall biosynthesis|nr:glycosyltransferase [Verrucomicrobiae bacterium]
MRDATPIKLLLVESGRAVGGTERVVWELATRLPEARFDVRVWLSDDPGVDELAAALEQADVGVDRVAEVESRWDWKGMFATWSKLRALKPDLVHIHHVWPAADRYLSMVARAAGVSHVVVTEHIMGESHSRGQRALKRDELKNADAVTAVTGAIVDTLVRDYGIERSLVRVIPNGADLPDEEREMPLARRWRERFLATPVRPLWVVVGRLEEQKGHDLLFEALVPLLRQGLDFTLAVAGDGSRRSWLEQRALSLGLSPRVQFVGQLDDVGPLLAAADGVILPSRWEGLPLVLLEAMARGRAIVATAVGGVADALEDGVTGTLVPPNDVGALAAALENLHRRADRAWRQGQIAAEVARDRYSWHAVVGEFESVYDEVLGLATVTPEGPAAARESSGREGRGR